MNASPRARAPEPTSTQAAFQARVGEVVRSIPPGRVASYGQVAALAGMPRGARHVGRALRLARAPMPWHRVITAAGRSAFPPGSVACREQLARLREEGVAVVSGRIDMRRFRWRPNLDEILWRLP